MTDDKLAAIEQRVQAATPGPWHAPGLGEVHTDHDAGVFIRRDEDGEGDPIVADFCSYPNWEGNAEFIAHAREDVPALLAEVRRLRAERDDVEVMLPAVFRFVHRDTQELALVEVVRRMLVAARPYLDAVSGRPRDAMAESIAAMIEDPGRGRPQR